MKTFPPLTPGCLTIQPSSNPKNGTAWRDIVRADLKFSPAYVGEALEQDAKLFCAAPDLLAALEALAATADNADADFKEYRHALRFSVQQARAAISKATA